MPLVVSPADEALAVHRALVRALSRPEGWPEPLPASTSFEVIETHISTLLLAGDGAIKLKKPLKLPFLDFSTPERRHHFCSEELRINRRTAPDLYRAVLPVTGSANAPRLGGSGPVLDWALWMRRFDNDQLYDRLARAGQLTAAHVDALAGVIAAFHAGLRPSPAAYGSAGVARRWALDNFSSLEDPELVAGLPAAAREQLATLAASSDSRLAAITPLLEQRRAGGAVVECHGDLHLGNIVHHHGRPLLFDAIEFNPELRHMDRLNDVAFTFMDLRDHGLPRLAWRLLSQYLEITGDYGGLPLLRWFAVDRALVRAKVALLAARQAPAGEAAPLIAAAARRIGLADALAHPAPARLVMTSGLSGSGKSTVALLLAESLGAVRIRSDVERKRLHGLAPNERPADPALLYNPRATAGTYGRLVDAARAALEGGVSAVVDAAFLLRAERDAVRELGRERQVACTVVECTAPDGVLAARIAHRRAHQSDPSDADAGVLALQMRVREPLSADEGDALTFSTDGPEHSLPGRVDDLARQLDAR
ncbi:MAG: AAA family ATPase [Chromatiales bacterium]|nr:AAA family ATPase [Chromatiales bacterium]